MSAADQQTRCQLRTKGQTTRVTLVQFTNSCLLGQISDTFRQTCGLLVSVAVLARVAVVRAAAAGVVREQRAQNSRKTHVNTAQ